MDTLLSDLRHAVRRCACAPGFTVLAILTVALGVGSTTAIYSVVDAILLRPLPYRDPGTLHQIWRIDGERRSQYLAHQTVDVWRTQQDLFSAVEPFRNRSVALLGSGEPQFVLAAEVGGNLMQTLGVPARIGRVIQPRDAEPGRDKVVVVSDELWRSRFASDPAGAGAPWWGWQATSINSSTTLHAACSRPTIHGRRVPA
jgi:putative ABC transport system permease protein